MGSRGRIIRSSRCRSRKSSRRRRIIWRGGRNRCKIMSIRRGMCRSRRINIESYKTFSKKEGSKIVYVAGCFILRKIHPTLEIWKSLMVNNYG